MPTITGGRYAVATISTVGTTSLTVSTTPFVNGDFTAKTRLIGLWSSTNIFKGMAWVRAWTSTSALQLQTEFFDPATGQTVSQAVGDKVLVSKDFAESVTTGVSVSSRSVNLTIEACTLGVANDQMGVCFYDENKMITIGAFAFQVAGGLVVFGKLDDYATNATSGGVSMQSASPSLFLCTSTSSISCVYGGRWQSSVSPAYIGCGGGLGTSAHTMIFNKVETPNDFVSVNTGGLWTQSPERHQLIGCISATANTNTIMCRWGDGIISGGQYKVLYNSNLPLAVFGSDAAGTYSISTPANKRAIVSDLGGGRAALFRTYAAGTAITCNFTNLITTDFRSTQGQDTPLAVNSNGINTFRFSDTFTNLVSGSVAVILNSSNANAATLISTGSTWSPSLLRRTCVGATVTVESTSWTYGFKAYGYNPVSGTITPSNYNVGRGVLADNVTFGGPIVQITDLYVTKTETQAANLTEILTLDDLYDAAIEWGVRTVANSKYPSLSQYIAFGDGNTVDFRSLNLVFDPDAASTIAVNTSTNTVTVKSSSLSVGSKFSTLTAGSIQINSTTNILQSGIGITGNTALSTPTNLSDVSITGDLTFNTNTPATVTFTNCTVTGTISNSGTAVVTVRNSGSTL